MLDRECRFWRYSEMLPALGRLMFDAALLEISARGSSCFVLRGVCTWAIAGVGGKTAGVFCVMILMIGSLIK